MTISTRIGLGISAAALLLSLALAPAAFAQDPMSQDLEFRNSLSRYDGAKNQGVAQRFPRNVALHQDRRRGWSLHWKLTSLSGS